MKKSWRPALLLLITALGMGMGTTVSSAAGLTVVRQEAERGGYRLITTDDLWNLVQQDPDGVLLVDTRQDWEYAAGHIEGAVNFSMEPT
ncbi:MAG: rhodanese-like domain-containing protein [Desulfurivibrionaceae bacterium]|nr:rhodanese-like domain-containing protein [Desulfobulbales bacterium]MDT8335561.1 rhodanese-like domain-containing protein [Desulfurivibrionaceae bacterium]